MSRKTRVIVGMSGGVDSSVAAWMLKAQGFEVVGLFMKNWEDDDTDEYCTSRADLVDAASVADVIGIELEAVNFAAEYRERVFAQFLREYDAGRTPNPDVLCNSEIKFRAFLDHARTLGADHIATGHYARVRRNGARVELLKARDASKDQSYFLHQLTQEQLAPVLFPLGETTKREVRAIARREGIPTWAKKDSTGHLLHRRAAVSRLSGEVPAADAGPDRDARRAPRRPARRTRRTTRSASGRVSAIGGTSDGEDLPWFVAGKDAARNALIVVQGHDHPPLYRPVVDAQELHWIAGAPPEAGGARSPRRQDPIPDARCDVPRRAARTTDAAARSSTRRNGRRRPGNISCSTTATCAWAAA